MKVWESGLASRWHLVRVFCQVIIQSRAPHGDRVSIPSSLQKPPQGHILVTSSDFSTLQRLCIQMPQTCYLRVQFSTHEYPGNTANLIRDQRHLPSPAAMNSQNVWRRKGSRGQGVGGGGRRRGRGEKRGGGRRKRRGRGMNRW